MAKRPIGIDVLTASKQRISYVFDNFQRIYLSFSGGKDSTAMLHMVMDEAIRRNRKIGVLFIDWEVQFKLTIDHVSAMFNLYKDSIIPYWVALPMTTDCAISQYDPEWVCWDEKKKDLWIRNAPDFAITSYGYFDFYRYAMTFEDFIVDFGTWYAQNGIKQPGYSNLELFEPTACFVGIRTDESFNRLLKITVSKNKEFHNGRRWLLNLKATKLDVYLAHPIYDWKTKDVWIFYGKFYKPYNKIYDLMYKAGIPLSKQRIDEFFGQEARKGLWMLQVIEPNTWAKVLGRITGCNSGALYSKDRGNINGDHKITKPNGHSWKSFAELLIKSMPEKTAIHYSNKISVYLKWYYDRGLQEIPDEQENDLKTPDVPSWRRICKVLLKNDYWCKALVFSPNKQDSYARYLRIMKKRRQQWRIWI